MKMPWPISNRHILNLREIKQDKNTFSVTITDSAVRVPQGPRKGFIRITNSHQVWTFTPLLQDLIYVAAIDYRSWLIQFVWASLARGS